MLLRAFCMISLLGAFLLPLSRYAQGQSGGETAKDLPEGKGKSIVGTVCQQCHGLEAITSSHRTLEEWKDVVNEMVSNGAPLQDDEIDTVAQYLAKNFRPANASGGSKEGQEGKEASSKPPSIPKINVNTSTAKELGTGLELSEKEAKAIVGYREKHGDFKNWEDLKKVDGLDAKKIEAAKERLEF